MKYSGSILRHLYLKPQNSASSWKCTLHTQDVYFIEKDAYWNINNISLNSLHCILQNMTYLNALIRLGALPASTKNVLYHSAHSTPPMARQSHFSPPQVFCTFSSCPDLQEKALRSKVCPLPVSETCFSHQTKKKSCQKCFFHDNYTCCLRFPTKQ